MAKVTKEDKKINYFPLANEIRKIVPLVFACLSGVSGWLDGFSNPPEEA